jgi:lactaldehyde dehydrogenase/glycolaldehyde dehydrogenase
VQRKIADEFTAKLAAAMQSATFGDPLGDAPVDMGPLINANHMHKVRTMVERAVADGAQLVTGGQAVEKQGGSYYQPTVLAACRQDMEIMQKEVFGPVLPVNVFDELEEAIDRANDSAYGLTSAIYTSNVSTALRACNEIRFGETYVNRENFEALQGFHAGVRQSGIGGADGKHGLYENTVHHIVYMQQ